MAKFKQALVEITDEDIDRGIRNHSGRCMVAEALKRAYPDAGKVMVDIQTIRFTDKASGERLIFLTPHDPQDLIVAFDAGEYSRLGHVDFVLRRKAAFRVQRQLPKTPEDHEKKKQAKREGIPHAAVGGVEYKVDSEEPNVIKRRNAARRSRSSTHRSYGRRALAINQARARTGDLPPDPEPIPGQE